MNRYTQLVPMPNPVSVNTGLSSCPTSLLIKRHGMPAAHLPADCGGLTDVTNEFWRSRMVTEDVGPFRATGYKWALELFRRGFVDLKQDDAALYDGLGSAGFLCVRHVRGIPGALSNHGLGMAGDLTLFNRLDAYNDGKVQAGLLTVYSHLKRHGLYWGLEFRREDAMHFEVSEEKIREWMKAGLL